MAEWHTRVSEILYALYEHISAGGNASIVGGQLRRRRSVKAEIALHLRLQRFEPKSAIINYLRRYTLIEDLSTHQDCGGFSNCAQISAARMEIWAFSARVSSE